MLPALPARCLMRTNRETFIIMARNVCLVLRSHRPETERSYEGMSF